MFHEQVLISYFYSLLLEARSDINAQDLDGWTPLHAAAHWGQREAVEILAENMADMDVRNFVVSVFLFYFCFPTPLI